MPKRLTRACSNKDFLLPRALTRHTAVPWADCRQTALGLILHNEQDLGLDNLSPGNGTYRSLPTYVPKDVEAEG
eukprot:219525-Heterocapsa_arctica.AAC.1